LNGAIDILIRSDLSDFANRRRRLCLMPAEGSLAFLCALRASAINAFVLLRLLCFESFHLRDAITHPLR
jgi:hypothetical protein